LLLGLISYIPPISFRHPRYSEERFPIFCYSDRDFRVLCRPTRLLRICSCRDRRCALPSDFGIRLPASMGISCMIITEIWIGSPIVYHFVSCSRFRSNTEPHSMRLCLLYRIGMTQFSPGERWIVRRRGTNTLERYSISLPSYILPAGGFQASAPTFSSSRTSGIFPFADK